MNVWKWPMSHLDKTKKTNCRFLVGSLLLAPTPKGVVCEMRIILQQWGLAAADPGSWCLDIIKYGTDQEGRSTGPFLEPGTRRTQHVQLSEMDWTAHFAPWGENGQWLLGELERLKATAPPLQSVLDTENREGAA